MVVSNSRACREDAQSPPGAVSSCAKNPRARGKASAGERRSGTRSDRKTWPDLGTLAVQQLRGLLQLCPHVFQSQNVVAVCNAQSSDLLAGAGEAFRLCVRLLAQTVAVVAPLLHVLRVREQLQAHLVGVPFHPHQLNVLALQLLLQRGD